MENSMTSGKTNPQPKITTESSTEIGCQFTAKAEQALDQAVRFYLHNPRVSLIDFGWKINDRDGRSIEKTPCIRIHVREKPYGATFEAFAADNPGLVIDTDLIDYPVDLPQANYTTNQKPGLEWYGWGAPPANPRGRVFNPLRGGISISNAMRYNYGTLGGRVVDRRTGREMILSNWHVLVGSWYVSPGTPIYQPGRLHGGTARNTIAYLERDAMGSFMDAAVAGLNPNRPMNNLQEELGHVTGVTEPLQGIEVTKSGSTTRVTDGIISGFIGRMVMNYDGIPRVIRNVVHISQTPAKKEVSAGGDSGSWWLEKSTNRAVGLHFAGSNVPEYALAISMPHVLDALDVRIEAGTA